jgi:integration host factor subunit beta
MTRKLRIDTQDLFPVFCGGGGPTVTKRELIEEVAQLYPRFSRRDAEVMVNAVFESMTNALAQGERIEIRGFGSFIVKQRAAREGRNPRTGTLVSVVAKKVPLFKVGKELRLRVDGQPVGAGKMIEGAEEKERA